MLKVISRVSWVVNQCRKTSIHELQTVQEHQLTQWEAYVLLLIIGSTGYLVPREWTKSLTVRCELLPRRLWIITGTLSWRWKLRLHLLWAAPRYFLLTWQWSHTLSNPSGFSQIWQCVSLRYRSWSSIIMHKSRHFCISFFKPHHFF